MYNLVIASMIFSFLFFLAFYFGFKISLYVIDVTYQKNNKNSFLPPKKDSWVVKNIKDGLNKIRPMTKDEISEQKEKEELDNLMAYDPFAERKDKK